MTGWGRGGGVCAGAGSSSGRGRRVKHGEHLLQLGAAHGCVGGGAMVRGGCEPWKSGLTWVPREGLTVVANLCFRKMPDVWRPGLAGCLPETGRPGWGWDGVSVRGLGAESG